MSGVTLTDTGYSFAKLARGHQLYVPGCKPRWWVVLEVESAHTMRVAPWTWISKVVSWNPCNDLELAAGAWE